jgi:hypothetical protein
VKAAILTATKRFGGLDVTWDALRRQTHRDFVWIVCDALYEDRRDEFWRLTAPADFGITYMPEPPRPEGWYSNLPAIYNTMIDVAAEHGADFAVSLQDYITGPDLGLELFDLAIQEVGPCLISGLCSHLATPGPKDTFEPHGLWSIWYENYVGPQYGDAVDLKWVDVRSIIYKSLVDPAGAVGACSPQEWEMNWAAFTLPVAERFDESYGEHIGHENIQFAWANKLARVPVLIQPSNHAFSVNHYDIFPEEEAEKQPHLAINQARHVERYGKLQKMIGGSYR